MKANQTTAEKGGLESNETKRGVRQASRRKQKGGESIYVIRSVVCSRKCCLSDLRVAVQLFSRAKETGLLSS